MVKFITRIILLTCIVCAVVVNTYAETKQAGERQISDITLIKPSDSNEINYLGLDGAGSMFALSDIKGKHLIIEIFNADCSTCKMQAPNVENLYDMIKKAGRDGEIKIIGIGAGSSTAEVAEFKSVHNVRFPLFPDPNKKIYATFTDGGTPQFIKLTRASGKAFVVVREGITNMNDPKTFLDSLDKGETPKKGVSPQSIYNPGHLTPIDSKAKVTVGDRAPLFTLPAVSGGKVSLEQYLGKKNVVLSFVPAAWTPVCSAQWPEYCISKERFDKADAVVLGITVDNLPTLYAWTGEMGKVWFPVLSDFYPHGKVAGMYGVLRSSGVTERALFIIDKKGIVRYVDVHDINTMPDNDVLYKRLQEINNGQ